MPSRLILSGLRSIEECIAANPERIAKILVSAGRTSPRVNQICEQAKKARIPIETNPKPDALHLHDEPLLALMKDYEYAELEEVLAGLKLDIKNGGRPVLLALDGITDPQNLGAILRTAAFMGIAGVILPKDRSAMINETVYRVASGGLEYLKVCLVTNLVSALTKAKETGFWTVGFSEHAEKPLSEIKPDFPPVLIIGNEEKGIRPLVEQNCDFLVRFDPKGPLKSLNASVASALALAWANSIF